MKPPKSEKRGNTFRFKSFSERLSAVNIDVIHKVGKRRETPENGETFFEETFIKWKDLNCTASFENFKTDLVGVDYQSLAQLLHNKTIILECLQRHLQIPKGTAYDAFLELVVALARDLLVDFYPHFTTFFEIISKHLKTKDSELLEQVFTTVSYLFKYLWRYMLKDIDNVYKLYSPLLDESNNDYIIDFATESISFLLRKVKDKEFLVDLIFSNLDEDVENIAGVGKLLCGVIQNVKQNFHSDAETMLYIILSKMGVGLKANRKPFAWSALVRCVSGMMESMITYTTRALSTATVVWDVFQKIMFELKETYECAESTDARLALTDHLGRVLELLLVGVSYKRGSAVPTNTQKLHEILLSILKLEMLPDNCVRPLVQIVASIILSPNITLEMAPTEKFIKAVFKGQFSSELKLLFSQKMYEFKMFETDVLPPLLHCCLDLLKQSSTQKDDVLLVLTKMVLRFRPLMSDDEGLHHWKRFAIEFSSPDCSSRVRRTHNKPFMEYLERQMNLQDSTDFNLTIPQLWCAVVCIPHTSQSHHSILVTHLNDLFKRLVEMCQQKDVYDGCLLLLAQTLESLQRVSQIGIIDEMFSLDDAGGLLINHSNNVHILRLIYSYLTYLQSHQRSEGMSPEFLSSIYPSLEPNLASPYHQVRLLTLKILVGFNYELPPAEIPESVDRLNVFEMCLAAERVKLGFEEHRERLRFITSLQANIIAHSLPTGGMYSRAPLYYLIGTLYVNFKPFWDPVVKLIETHARAMEPDAFWEVFGSFLRTAADGSSKVALGGATDSSKKQAAAVDDDEDASTLDSIFFAQKKLLENTTERVDHVNHRSYLWKVLLNVADLAESRSDLLSGLLLDFVRKEYHHVETIEAQTQDLSRVTDTSTANDVEESDEEEEEDEDSEMTDGKEPKKGRRVKESITSTQSLCAHLKVFARFRNPKVVDREPELKELYLRLLQNKKQAVQELALDCIATYRHAHLAPYKDNFYRILKPATFRSEITRFGIAAENSVVLPEHRSHVIPLLMRILYGKMAGKEPLNKHGGRDAFVVKRNVIFQFVANSSETEMSDFLALAFAPYVSPDDDKLLTVVRRILDNRDFTAFDPLNKIRGALLHLDIVFKNLGHRIRSVLPWLLRVLVVLAAKITVLLENRELIQPYLLDKLKQLRIIAIERVSDFFVRFDNYPFVRHEIDALFLVIVWPQLPRMPTELQSSPNALLQLFASWSRNPRYFVLLTKHKSDDVSLVPVRLILELLSNERMPNSVVSVVLEVATNLLTLEDHQPAGTVTNEAEPSGDGDGVVVKCEPMELGEDRMEVEDCTTAPAIDITDVLPVETGKCDSGGLALNYGTLILLPYITHLMTRLKQIIAKTSRSAAGIPAKHLTVLKRLSEIVTDGNYCKELAALLVPFLNKNQKRTEESEAAILNIIITLVKLANNPKTFLNQLPILFSTVTNRRSRALLCDLLAVVAADQKGDKSVSDMVLKMNAWNVRRPEEPDYKRRLAAFQTANEAIDRVDSHLDQTMYLFIIYNCVFLISVGQDQTMRDTASHCLQHIAKKLGQMSDKQAVQQLMMRTLLPEVNRGLKTENEEIRNEYVAILAECVRACPELPVCKDLQPLLDNNPDLDFFESLKHMQLHRRAAGMRRLAEGDTCAKIKPEVLINYVLPQAHLIIYHEKYITQKLMVSAAVQLIGKICCHLNWSHYEKQLRYFIERLSKSSDLHQSRTVKALSSVLDAFHFNLSNSTLLEDRLVAPPQKMKADRHRRNASDGDENADEEMEDATTTKSDRFPPLDQVEATKIHTVITKSILPQLQKHLSSRVQNYSQAVSEAMPGDSEVLRVPMATTIVRLLQNLPKSQLDSNLPNILLKICGFLKSRTECVRKTTRDTLVNIMCSLGPAYLPFLVQQIDNVLVRGYQLHVKIYSIHTVLAALVPQLQPGDLDSCLFSLIKMCQDELFGKVAEEKEVAALVSKCSESKTKQSFKIYEILAKFATEGQLKLLVNLLQQRLKITIDGTEVTKIEECFKRISVGLASNPSISFRNLLVFSYVIFSEAVAIMEEKKVKVEVDTTPAHLVRPDTFLVPKEPGRAKAAAPVYARTNAHVSAAFAVSLLHMSLKAGQIKVNEVEHLEMLDPFIPKLAITLASPNDSLLLASVQCLNVLLRSRLPSVQDHVAGIADSAFALLKKYGQGGKKSTNNRDLVHRCFKMLTVLISQVPNYRLATSDLRVILVYVEQDMMDSEKHATAFTMLKAILSRKLILPEIRAIMAKVIELSITCSTDHIRVQCRLCVFKYLTDYPLGDKVIMTHLNFYMRQLEYSEEFGRNSALEMLTTVFDTFPPAIINENAAVFFIPLATRLINDKAELLRKMTALALSIFLQRISPENKDNMFMFVETWIKEANNITHRRMACTLMGIFAEAEKEMFQGRVGIALPLLVSQLKPLDSSELNSAEDQNSADQLLFHALTAIRKIVDTCDVVRHTRYRKTCNTLWEKLFELMHYSYLWVQMRTVELVGIMLSNYNVEEFPALLYKKSSRDKTPDYLLENFPNRFGQFFFKFAWQGVDAHQIKDMDKQLLFNLLYIARILCRVPEELLTVDKSQQDSRTTRPIDKMVAKESSTAQDAEQNDEDDEGDAVKDNTLVVSFGYLARTLKLHAEREGVKARGQTTRRSIYCNWVLNLVPYIPKELVEKHLTILLIPLVREVMSTNKDEALSALTNEAIDRLRTIVGVAVFSQHYSSAQMLIAETRMKRKRDRAIMAVAEPEARAKEKIKNHQRNTARIKRKRAELHFQGANVKRHKVKRAASP